VAASIVSVIACSCASAAPFLKSGLTNIRVAIVLETATTLGALTGVFLTGVLPAPFLFALFAAILLVSAWQMTCHSAWVMQLGHPLPPLGSYPAEAANPLAQLSEGCSHRH
jgi:uncharacterized membrane protein YfcA